jgi:hypothetical protein
MSLTKATYSMIEGAPVNVLDYGASTSSANCSAEFAAALAAVPTNGTLYIPAGVYRTYLLVWRGDITIMGDGSASTILKLPDNCPTITVPHDGVPNPITGLPNVIEVGKCALGNAAPVYANVTIKGLTVDGNYTNNVAPVTDLFGHGCIITKTSNVVIEDFVAKDCYMTGIDVVINSNYANITARTENCGQAPLLYPNFDINSSKYSIFNIVSIGGAFGGRMLDNCWGNTLTISVDAPDYTGLVYNNQSVNNSYGNTINVNVVGGCDLGQGVSIGSNCRNSTINANIYGVVGVGFFVAALAGSPATGNQFNINTHQCGLSGVNANAECFFNAFNICSVEDGRSGPSGTSFAVDVDGATDNQFTVSIKDGPVSQVRGLIFRAGSDNNRVIDMQLDTNLVEVYNDLGTSNYVNWGSGGSASIASAAAINLPYTGGFFNVTGTSTIATVAPAAAMNGRVVTLRFDSAITIAQSSGAPANLFLAGGVNFSATANDTLTLASDGTNWIEVARSVN